MNLIKYHEFAMKFNWFSDWPGRHGMSYGGGGGGNYRQLFFSFYIGCTSEDHQLRNKRFGHFLRGEANGNYA